MKLEDTVTVELVVRGRRAVAIGGCEEIATKVDRLVRAGANVELFSSRSDLCARLRSLVQAESIALVERRPSREDVDGAAVVFVSPNEESLGAELAAAARERGTLVCTLDRPEAATFVNPGSADVSGLRVTVSSGGTAPALVRRLREDLEAILGGPGVAGFVRELGELRRALPRGERGAVLREKIAGFRLEGRVVFPRWYDEA